MFIIFNMVPAKLYKRAVQYLHTATPAVGDKTVPWSQLYLQYLVHLQLLETDHQDGTRILKKKNTYNNNKPTTTN